MSSSLRSPLRRWLRLAARASISSLPKDWRFKLFRAMVDCDLTPDPRLELKIAETQAELEACFALLHDVYVSAGFMKPDPSGLRVTPYHALPTTTTLCAKFEGRVVGTLSLIRDGVFGFPMQSAFDLTAVRRNTGQIAEVSALAVHSEFRRSGGWILFPLMKFMYEYATRYFDTRFLLIAVNPDKIELYESLMFFDRLSESSVDRYDFANGAPAVGAVLDLQQALVLFDQTYAGRRPRKNLYHYFVEVSLPNIQLPARPYHTTNDPVLTPQLLDYFFNQHTRGFSSMDDRRRMLLRSIYDLKAYAAVLPPVQRPEAVALRHHPRYTMVCPAQWTLEDASQSSAMSMRVIELSRHGLLAHCQQSTSLNRPGLLRVELGRGRMTTVRAQAVRQAQRDGVWQLGFDVDEPDATWLTCVRALDAGQTYADLTVRPAQVRHAPLARSDRDFITDDVQALALLA